MSATRKSSRSSPATPSSEQKKVEEKVKSQDPRACIDERQTGKSKDKQRRESRLEVGRPKDSGRCGA